MRAANAPPLSPTETTYAAFQTAYDHFNLHLFENNLPPCLITLGRRDRRTFGHFAPARFREIDGSRRTDEIAMNPQHFIDRPVAEVLSTLAHEQVHLWQAHFGKASRTGYHNKQWAIQMKQIGLQPSDNGQPDGKETGQHMSHYAIPKGPFDAACKSLLSHGFKLAWGELVTQIKKRRDDGDDDDDDRSNRVKYTCPRCSINAWGKPDILLICGRCKAHLLAAGRMSEAAQRPARRPIHSSS